MFNRPSLSDLINRTTNDVFQRLQQDNVLRRADAQVYARVLAGVAHGLYGFIEWISRQIIIDTAEAEFLERWASIWRVERLTATPATGTITFTVAPDAADIPVGTLVQTLDGTQFQTTADITVSGLQATTSVTAVVPSAASNNYAGQTANLVTPVLGVQTTAVLGTLSGGGDRELDDSLREKLLNRIQNRRKAGMPTTTCNGPSQHKAAAPPAPGSYPSNSEKAPWAWRSSAMAMAPAPRSFHRPRKSQPWRPTSTRSARSPHM